MVKNHNTLECLSKKCFIYGRIKNSSLFIHSLTKIRVYIARITFTTLIDLFTSVNGFE